MATEMIIRMKDGVSVRDRNTNDILVYDNKDNSFYFITPEMLYEKHNQKMMEMQKNYDDKVEKLEKENQDLKQQFIKFTKTIQELNEKQIAMVEKFIKEGDK